KLELPEVGDVDDALPERVPERRDDRHPRRGVRRRQKREPAHAAPPRRPFRPCPAAAPHPRVGTHPPPSTANSTLATGVSVYQSCDIVLALLMPSCSSAFTRLMP